MKKCENCGFENEDNAIKCSRCNYLFIEFEKNTSKNEEKDMDNYNLLFNHNNTNKNIIPQGNTFNDENGYYEIDISKNSNIILDTNEENLLDDDYNLMNEAFNHENVDDNPYDSQDRFNSNKNPKHKNPIIGLVLSFLVSGLGNLYAGLYRRGIFQIIISVILNYMTFILYPNNMILTAINLLWAFYVMYDSYICIVSRNKGKEVPLLLGFIRFNE